MGSFVSKQFILKCVHSLINELEELDTDFGSHRANIMFDYYSMYLYRCHLGFDSKHEFVCIYMAWHMCSRWSLLHDLKIHSKLFSVTQDADKWLACFQ